MSSVPASQEDWSARISGDLTGIDGPSIGYMRGYVIGVSYKDQAAASQLATTLNTNLKLAQDVERTILCENMEKRLRAKYGDLV